jgi:serine protease Do
MNRKFLRSATSGFAVLGAALSFNLLNAVSSVELLNLARFGQGNASSALAQTQDQEEEVNVRVYQQASPAVVSIDAGEGTGSGIIISRDGLVLTNAHVVSGAEKVKVTLADGREFEADVIAFGENGLDLAAVRIDGQNDLPTVAIASPGSVAVGQRAFAIGNPFGQFQGTFTTGIVSRVDGNRGLIQTDTAINPGNSGGPLLNSKSELIGVNSAIFSPGSNGTNNTGIGFAISVDRVEPFLTAVREGTAPRVAQQSPLLGGGYTAERIAMNTPVNGQLDSDSNILPTDRSFFDAYTFEGRRGDRVTIEMSSTQVDAFIILLAPDGQNVAQDDDSGGGSNARLTAALPVDGIYTVLANTYSAGETGEYSIRLVEAGATLQEQGQTLQRQSGEALLREEGTLGLGSPVLPSDGSFYQEYSFEGRQGQSITVSMESEDFDTYVIVIDANDRVIAQNDDASPQNTNSVVTVTLPEDGTYRVIANTYDRTGSGRYTLEVR